MNAPVLSLRIVDTERETNYHAMHFEKVTDTHFVCPITKQQQLMMLQIYPQATRYSIPAGFKLFVCSNSGQRVAETTDATKYVYFKLDETSNVIHAVIARTWDESMECVWKYTLQ